ncbi:Subtilase family protein [Azospirillum lipoferum]|nr:Subtilase family protein [Azospirillum lipoferum]
MADMNVLIEVRGGDPLSLSAVEAVAFSAGPAERVRRAEALLADLPGLGVDVLDDIGPIPLASGPDDPVFLQSPGLFGMTFEGRLADTPGSERTFVVSAQVKPGALARLEERDDIIVWPNSPITLLGDGGAVGDGYFGLFDLAGSGGGTDCRPFRPGVSVDAIRQLLGVEALWRDGYRGQNVIVAVLDEGVNGAYPVVGGFEKDNQKLWGIAPIHSHGSMCAADILVAAPAARLYDYPFLGQPRSGGALAMFQAVLERRRRDGTPHLTNNSYGYVAVPDRATQPRHEIWDINHPLHRKIREVVAEGVACFFAAGNCGSECPSSVCHSSGTGRGRSIHASNSLSEVVTVAAVNSRHERIGYSSQGPGMFDPAKPDIAGYSHFFGNFGPGRPAGLAQPFDNGTSAATPVVCGVAAALASVSPGISPQEMKAVLMESAIDIGEPGPDHLTGSGVVNAAAAYQLLKRRRVPTA